MTPWPTFVQRRRPPRRGCPVPARYPRTCSRSVRWRPCRPGLLHDRPAVLSSTVWTPRHGMSGQTVSMARGPPEISSAAQTAMVAVVPPIMLTVTSGRRRAARPRQTGGNCIKNGRQEYQGDSHRHSPASVSDRSVLTLRLSRRLVLPVRTETCTKIRTNAAGMPGSSPLEQDPQIRLEQGQDPPRPEDGSATAEVDGVVVGQGRRSHLGSSTGPPVSAECDVPARAESRWSHRT